MEYIPYTYLIGWSKLNLWYYGAKYGNNSNPKTFWKDYFTSSKQVKYMREKFGEPSVIQVRKTFKDAKSCTNWEQRVIERIRSKNNPNNHIWINQNDGFGDFYKKNNVPEYISYARKEYFKNRTDEQIKRDYEARLKAASNEEGRRKNSEKALLRNKDPEYRAKMEKIWASEEFSKIRSEASKKGMDKNGIGYQNHSKVVQSEEYKKKISDLSKKAFSNPETKKKHKESLAKYNNDPEVRKKKSELAKLSSSNRIATSFMNKLDNDVFKNISFDDLLKSFYEKFSSHTIDEARLKSKFEEKKKET